MPFDKQEDLFHQILIKRVALFLAVSCLALILVRLSLGTLPYLATIIAAVAIFSYCLIYYLTNKGFSSALGAWLICIVSLLGFVIAGYVSGGLHAPVILAYPLIPLVSALLIDHRAAIIMGTLSISTIVIYFILDINGYSFPLPISDYRAGVMRGTWLIFTIFLVTIIGWYYSRKNESLKHILKEQADTDFLTNLSNRRKLDEALKKEFYRTRRNNNWLSILLLDIDHFKKLNDAEGHLKGDECLKLVAKEIGDYCKRATDIAGRYGGEEFMLVLPDIEPSNAIKIAESLRKSVENIEIESASQEKRNITITIGALSIQGTKFNAPAELIKIVDDLLYEGKQSGRNKVVSKTYTND